MKRRKTRSSLAVVTVLGMLLALLPLTAVSAGTGPAVFINEIHYDNASTDAGEFVEIAGPAGTDLTGWTVALYNGNGGGVYNTTTLGGTIPDQVAGYGTVSISYPSNGLQNGAPDGLALVDAGATVVQFLSYEGAFNAVGGPADGMTSTDVGVAESSSTPLGFSLQLTGTGTTADDFTWAGPSPESPGSINAGQTFGEPPTVTIAINEIMQNPSAVGDSDGEWFELYNTTDATVDINGWTMRDDGSDSHLIDNGGPLTIASGGYLILGRNADPSTNGGVSVDYEYADFFLSNSADEVVLVDLGQNEVDRVNYDNGATFPDPNGASMSVIDSTVNNNSGDNWCTSTTPFGDGDNGTPGGENSCEDPLAACGADYTPVYEIQGNGWSSSFDGSHVWTEGVITGDFQEDNELKGFYLQDPEGDLDATTSDGVFVYYGFWNGQVDVGQHVRVSATVDEFFGLTELTNVVDVLQCSTGSVAPKDVELPLTGEELEALEGMLVNFPADLYISEFFNYERYGEIVLSTDRQFQPTALFGPSSPDAVALAAANEANRITLDDGQSDQNPDFVRHPNGATFTMTNRFRGGDTLTNVVGVMDYAFGSYKIQPTAGATYANANPRSETHDPVGGSLEVAAFNVLNYFTTFGSRGAGNLAEFDRQRDKIFSALAAIDADVVGLMEIENNGDIAVGDLVDGLNAVVGAGTYEYVSTGVMGTDAIANALIYKPSAVSLVGDEVVLDAQSFVDPLDTGDDRSRPAIAQTFIDDASGEVFTVVVNHFKSKSGSETDDEGGICVDADPGNDIPDCDQGDGQAYFNATRTAAAQALVDWLAGDPTASGDDDFMIIGDLNSYDHEDPIGVLEAAGFKDLLLQFEGENAYSYVFDGQLGYLDYALVSPSLLSQVEGATAWHVNTDEPGVIDYDLSFKSGAQKLLYADDAFRSSDHDPVIVGLRLGVQVTATPDTLWAPNHKYVEVEVSAWTNAGVPLTVVITDAESSEDESGYGKGDKPNDVGQIDGNTVELRAERYTPEGRVYTIHVDLYDGTAFVTSDTVEVTVPHDQRDKKVKAR